MANKSSEVLTNFRVYNDGNDLLGVADIDLPDIESMTETIKGAGIAGELDAPILGHYSSMSCTINWRTITENSMELVKPKSHSLEFRGAAQVFDAGSGEYSIAAQKFVIKAVPKKVGLGKLDVGTKQDTSTELSISYIKVFLDGKVMFELDKYNYICIGKDGVDYLAGVREALGL